jgi:hypothetical protein
MATANAEVIETPAPKVSAFKDAFNKTYRPEAPAGVKEVVPPAGEKKEDEPKAPSLNPMEDAFKKATTPPKEEPKVTETPVKDDKEQNFAALRKAREEADKRAVEAEKRAKEFEAKIPTDYETLKAERAKLSEEHALLTSELKKYSVQSTPEFKQKYDSPMQNAAQQIEKSVLVDGGKADKMLSLLKQPESKERNESLSELMEELSPLSKTKVANAVADYDRLRELRENEIENPDQTLKLNQEAQMKARVEQQKIVAREIENVIEDATKEFTWLKKGQNAELDVAIDELNEEARAIWLKPSSTQQQAQVAFKAALTPRLFKWLKGATDQIETLNAELAKARGSSPKLNIENPDTTPKPPTGKGAFMAAFNAASKPKTT